MGRAGRRSRRGSRSPAWWRAVACASPTRAGSWRGWWSSRGLASTTRAPRRRRRGGPRAASARGDWRRSPRSRIRSPRRITATPRRCATPTLVPATPASPPHPSLSRSRSAARRRSPQPFPPPRRLADSGRGGARRGRRDSSTHPSGVSSRSWTSPLPAPGARPGPVRPSLVARRRARGRRTFRLRQGVGRGAQTRARRREGSLSRGDYSAPARSLSARHRSRRRSTRQLPRLRPRRTHRGHRPRPPPPAYRTPARFSGRRAEGGRGRANAGPARGRRPLRAHPPRTRTGPITATRKRGTSRRASV